MRMARPLALVMRLLAPNTIWLFLTQLAKESNLEQAVSDSRRNRHNAGDWLYGGKARMKRSCYDALPLGDNAHPQPCVRKQLIVPPSWVRLISDGKETIYLRKEVSSEQRNAARPLPHKNAATPSSPTGLPLAGVRTPDHW